MTNTDTPLEIEIRDFNWTALKEAERALEEAALKHTRTRHHDAWCVKEWKE